LRPKSKRGKKSLLKNSFWSKGWSRRNKTSLGLLIEI
jgi:hypothetical protein